jgi:hypothetical protein
MSFLATIERWSRPRHSSKCSDASDDEPSA